MLQYKGLSDMDKVYKNDSTKVATHVSHKLLWKPDAKPVQHKVQNIPLAVWPAVAKKL